MTATLERISKNTDALSDREIAQLATELFNDAMARYHDPDASDDTKAAIGALYSGFYARFRPQVVEEIKPHLEEAVRKASDGAREVWEPKGRVTLNLRFATTMTVDNGVSRREFASGELVQAGYPHDKIFSESTFQHLEIADLYDGQVISLDLPNRITVLQERVVDTSKVELPANWTSDLAGALATALRELPAPIVEVENVVETPQVQVDIHEAPDEGMKITFDRDRGGRISGATTKPID